jgi:hypothetical protein
MFKFLNNLVCFYSHMINNLFIYLTRGVEIGGGGGGGGGQGGQAPQVLPSALFPGAKCLFLAWKMS